MEHPNTPDSPVSDPCCDLCGGLTTHHEDMVTSAMVSGAEIAFHVDAEGYAR